MVHTQYDIYFRVMQKESSGRLLFIQRKPCLRLAVMTKAYGIDLSVCYPQSVADTTGGGGKGGGQ